MWESDLLNVNLSLALVQIDVLTILSPRPKPLTAKRVSTCD